MKHGKGHVTHVDDGFVFLGHRIICKRGAHGRMSIVTTIPKEKAKGFVRKLTETFSGNHSVSTVDMIAGLNRQLVDGRRSTSSPTSRRTSSGALTMSCSGKWRIGW